MLNCLLLNRCSIDFGTAGHETWDTGLTAALSYCERLAKQSIPLNPCHPRSLICIRFVLDLFPLKLH